MEKKRGVIYGAVPPPSPTDAQLTIIISHRLFQLPGKPCRFYLNYRFNSRPAGSRAIRPPRKNSICPQFEREVEHDAVRLDGWIGRIGTRNRPYPVTIVGNEDHREYIFMGWWLEIIPRF